MMDQWKPIETAPKNNEEPFLAREDYIDDEGDFSIFLIGYWSEHAQEFRYGSSDESHRDATFHPTAWAAIPQQTKH